jgi:choline dehydrogenase-like flavoprotein
MTSRRDEYDVCIIGSGAGGGMAAWALTRAGARVVVLEAGGPWDNMSSDSAMLKWPYDTSGAGLDDRAAVRRVRCLHRWLGDRGRAILPRRGHEVQLVAGADGGRADQPLGTHLPPVRAR